MTLKRTQTSQSPCSLLHLFQAHTFRQQRSLSRWWEEVEPERQQLWPGRSRAQLRTEHPTGTGPSLSWTTLLWSRARLNQATTSVMQKNQKYHKSQSYKPPKSWWWACVWLSRFSPSLIWFEESHVLPQRGATWGRPCCSTQRSLIPASVLRALTTPGQFSPVQSASAFARPARLALTARDEPPIILQVLQQYVRCSS